MSRGWKGGAAAARALLERAPIDSLFCANDLIACGAMDAARGRGLSCPGDIRIIGFDNIEQASWPTYALTTVDQQINVLVTMVMRAVMNGAATERHQLIEARLIERGSTASVSQGS